jgi:ABC-type enterochelin transport system substrate-binding protein
MIPPVCARVISSRFLHHQQRRHISLLDKLVISSPANEQLARDLKNAIALVRKYDPVGYLPGLLIATNTGKIGYFASKKESSSF